MSKKKDLKDELFQAGLQWRQAIRSVGEILRQLEEEGQPVRMLIHEILWARCGMPKATAVVALRWAKGELGDDDQSNLLVSQVSHSRLALWSSKAIHEAVKNEHVIMTDSGRAAKKRIRDMTPDEIKRNTNADGFVPVSQPFDEIPSTRKIYIRSIIEEDGAFIAVSKGRETIYAVLTETALKQLDELRAVCTA